MLKKMFYLALQKDCPSGQLTRSKFLDIYQAMFPDGKDGAFYEHVFRTFDEDGSGKIDFKEFLQVSIEKSEKIGKFRRTRLHSSRMRTARA